jgi:hypothetical protein
MLAAFILPITRKQQKFSLRRHFSAKGMNSDLKVALSIANNEVKLCHCAIYAQGDEFTCVEPFPLRMAML